MKMARTPLYFYSPIWALFILLFIFSGCRKDLPSVQDPETGSANNYVEVFDRFWNGMNNNYQFWDVDTTNWDKVYRTYRPLFEKLDINNPDDQRKSVGYFRNMLSGTIDGHLFVGFESPTLVDSVIDPRSDQSLSRINPNVAIGESKRTEAYYYFNYYDLDEQQYLDPGSISGTYDHPDVGLVNVLCGTINQNILYFGYNGQALTYALKEKTPNVLKTAFEAFSAHIKNNNQLIAIVIDLRGSSGGNGNDANIFAQLMINQPLHFGEVRYKNGLGRLDYTPWTPITIQPAPGNNALKVPLYILTDFFTLSAAEVMTATLHAIPKAATIGSATMGGLTGSRMLRTIQGKSAFTIRALEKNFLWFGISSGAFRTLSGERPIWGIAPDYLVPFDPEAIEAGRDPQLEKVLKLVGK